MLAMQVAGAKHSFNKVKKFYNSLDSYTVKFPASETHQITNSQSGSSTYQGCTYSVDNRLVDNSFFDNGERIATTKQVREYKKRMNSIGINVVVDKKGTVLNGNRAAGFDYATGTVYIRKTSGVIDLYHEGYHAEQYLSLGKENYINLGTLAREEYVYQRIVDSSVLFNEAELNGATKYISNLRRRYK